MYLYSFSQDNLKTLKDQADELYSTIETAAINKEVPPNFRSGQKKHADIKEQLEKIHRWDYIEFQLKFLESLGNLALDVKKIEMSERKKYLWNWVGIINYKLDKLWSEKFDYESTIKVKF